MSFPPETVARHLERVRSLAIVLPGATERLSHGEPTFFAGKRVFAMMSTDHHGDGHVAVVLPVEPGLQEIMIAKDPKCFYRPPYVGGAGWVGIELPRIRDASLRPLIEGAWRLVAPKRVIAAWDAENKQAR